MKAILIKFTLGTRSWWYYNLQENDEVGQLLWYCGQRRYTFKQTKADLIAKGIATLVVTFDKSKACDGYSEIPVKSVYVLDRAGQIIKQIKDTTEIEFLMSQYPIYLKKSDGLAGPLTKNPINI